MPDSRFLSLYQVRRGLGSDVKMFVLGGSGVGGRFKTEGTYI